MTSAHHLNQFLFHNKVCHKLHLKRDCKLAYFMLGRHVIKPAARLVAAMLIPPPAVAMAAPIKPPPPPLMPGSISVPVSKVGPAIRISCACALIPPVIDNCIHTQTILNQNTFNTISSAPTRHGYAFKLVQTCVSVYAT